MCVPDSDRQPPKRRGPVIGLIRLLIRAYQLTLSAFIGRTCRYLPTCSEYADEALARHGAWAGLWMALARFARCNPWGGDGFDPVPTERPASARWWAPWRYGDWSGRNVMHSVRNGSRG